MSTQKKGCRVVKLELSLLCNCISKIYEEHGYTHWSFLAAFFLLALHLWKIY